MSEVVKGEVRVGRAQGVGEAERGRGEVVRNRVERLGVWNVVTGGVGTQSTVLGGWGHRLCVPSINHSYCMLQSSLSSP